MIKLYKGLYIYIYRFCLNVNKKTHENILCEWGCTTD
jgi:hypothetical protein